MSTKVGVKFIELNPSSFDGNPFTMTRNELEYEFSGGLYLPEDIEQILEAQKFCCYFTGDPLSSNPKNYQIDHLTPIYSGGSSWPLNIALLTKTANLQKTYQTRAEYWRFLQRRNGESWVNSRKEECREIDKARRIINKNRKAYVASRLSTIQEEIAISYPSINIRLSLIDDHVILGIEKSNYRLPKGFLRKKSALKNSKYYIGCIRDICGAASPT